MDNRQWFQEAKFGMFIHWGLYSVLGGEYKGKRTNYTGEWIMSKFNIPIKEYEKVAEAFNPIYFDAEEIVKLAVDAGMKYIVFTAKHHEGFAMYHSKVDSFNVIDATPFKRDIVREMGEACRKYNIKFGLYYSHELDWHEEHGGGYSITSDVWDHVSWSNNWDFDNDKKDFSICFKKKIKPQIKELLTEYGKVDLLWCDCPTDITKEQSQELYDFIKELQPDCLVCSRIGCREYGIMGDFGSAADNDLNDQNEHQIMYEIPATLNDTWGYKTFDNNWKSPEEVLKNLREVNSRGINYLLNVGPDYLGRIPLPSVKILREVGRRLREE